MGYQPLEELLPKSGWSVYKLVRIASKRALEISETGAKLIQVPINTKLATIALEEIHMAKVVEKDAAKDFEPKANGKK
ncbi:MAG: DNA-directed RNA polymerase subunit omega [Candidatus Omnitrophica bacterium]|nr:DNA-directed RNA polymerase subunit omega [Candidatus Omnitrophota bacterium]